MRQDDLTRLWGLREKRKDKALEAVTARHAAFMRAEQQLAEAEAAVSAHLDLARQRETSGLSEMMGKVISHVDLSNLRSELTGLGLRLEDLRAEAKARGSAVEAAQAALKSATAIYHEHARAAEKLRQLVAEEKRKRQRKGLALAEAGDDESHRRRPVARLGK